MLKMFLLLVIACTTFTYF